MEKFAEKLVAMEKAIKHLKIGNHITQHADSVLSFSSENMSLLSNADIPQIDGHDDSEDVTAVNCMYDENSRILTEEVTQPNETSAQFIMPGHPAAATEKYCEFCDEEFTLIEDFRKHMNNHGYICSNCLDFFSDMSWFPTIEAELTFIKGGAVPAMAFLDQNIV